MYFKQLVSIQLMVIVLGAQSCVRSGKDHVRAGEESPHGLESSAQRRTVNQKGDHLFNNIAKALTDLIQDMFTETRLMSFVKANAVSAQKGFIITDKTEDKDVSNLFPNMVNDYLEYKNDGLLTTGSDISSTYALGQTGDALNVFQWNKTVEELRKMVFELIDKTIEATWLEKEYKQQEKTLLNGMFHNIRARVAQMIDGNEYSDQPALNAFMDDEMNTDSMPKVKAVEGRIAEVLNCLPTRIQSWSMEAARFFKMKLNRQG